MALDFPNSALSTSIARPGRVTDEYRNENPGPFTNRDDPKAGAFDLALSADAGTNVLKLRLGLILDQFNFSVFADNVLGAHPQLNLAHNFPFDPTYYANTFRPRTMGVTATYRF
jgi:iron complex outermembrane recepter protein